MTNSPIVLQCKNITKTYTIESNFKPLKALFGYHKVDGALIKALDDISLEVPKGKIVGVLGKNGAGKSTLLRVLGGVYHPDEGHIHATGHIAGLFELGGFGNNELTGREFAKRYLQILGASKLELSSLLEDIQDFSELEGAFDQKIRTYSSGMQSRLYFSTLTALQHEIYLIDELLSVGDQHFQTKSWQRMRNRLLTGASGVLVTHDWESILKLCEESRILEKGKFTCGGDSDKVVVKYLDLPPSIPSIAQFSSDNLQEYTVSTGENITIPVHIDILKHQAVDLSVSIELLRIGIGWEILLLCAPEPISELPGTYVINVSIPKLPLPPGKYSLNLFLTQRKKHASEKAVSLDSRSWTTANGLALNVIGPPTNAAAKLPYQAYKMEYC